MLEQTEYRKELMSEGTEEALDRLANIDELLNKAASYAEHADNPSLGGFLEEVALVADIDNLEEDADHVVMMTLHSAKGLEFPVVFMVGMEDGMFPSYISTVSYTHLRHLWETSGHWDHYKENMYTTVIDDTDFAIKPMNCPGGILVYQSEPRSYRDLPLRMGELGLVHRHEKSGQLHGLMRVRCFTQDDAHIFMMPEQIREEIKGVAKLIDEVYQLFGFKYHVELSTRPENSMGSAEDWEMATEALRGALDDLGRDYVVNEGDGAFYGPKIDFHLEDSIGRTWQCGTIQLDFQLPQRFECEYIGADGEKHRPIMIHRVAFGSIERFIGILIEHFAGAFPTWLSPEQVRVLPISDKYLDYAQQVNAKLNDEGVRSSVDSRAEKIGYKIRDARLQKVPYMLIVGAKEEEEKLVSVRSRFAGDEGQTTLDAFLDNIKEEIRTRVLRETVAEEDEKKKD